MPTSAALRLSNLVVAKGYLSKPIANSAVHQYLARHYHDILDSFELVVNTVSMEQAVDIPDRAEPLELDEIDHRVVDNDHSEAQ
jgi:hypothetical protein